MTTLTRKKSVNVSQNWDQKVNVVKTRDLEAHEVDQLVETRTGEGMNEMKNLKNQDPNVKLKPRKSRRKSLMVRTSMRSQLSEKRLERQKNKTDILKSFRKLLAWWFNRDWFRVITMQKSDSNMCGGVEEKR